MITDIIGSLRAEREAGDNLAQDVIARLDRHIRDLETTKEWIRVEFGARSLALGAIVGDEDPIKVEENTGNIQISGDEVAPSDQPHEGASDSYRS